MAGLPLGPVPLIGALTSLVVTSPVALIENQRRRFLAFSERAARAHGLTPAQHQLLLAIRGYSGDGAPSTSDVAELLQLKLHSVGELADRAVEHDLVERTTDPADGRRSLLTLTAHGCAQLDELSQIHRRELRELRPELEAVLGELS